MGGGHGRVPGGSHGLPWEGEIWKPESGIWKPDTGIWKPNTGIWKPETLEVHRACYTSTPPGSLTAPQRFLNRSSPTYPFSSRSRDLQTNVDYTTTYMTTGCPQKKG